MSRPVRDLLLDGEIRAVVRGVQRRACQLLVEAGPLLVLSATEIPLAPNAFAVDLGPHQTPADAGFRAGQSVSLGSGLDFPTVRPCRGAGAVWKSDSDPVVLLGEASIWEPRPRVHRVDGRLLAERLRAVRATVVAEGAGASLLPLLWATEVQTLAPGAVGAARLPVRRLSAAAIRCDPAVVADAARGLAGLGPGLTPSGDDLLAGFAASWALVGESLGVDASRRRRVTDALLAGAERGASPLGLAWLGHAGRGELLEPMTQLVGALLAAEAGELHSAARAAVAVGSSSGTDWMVGFLLGASAILDATARGRRW